MIYRSFLFAFLLLPLASIYSFGEDQFSYRDTVFGKNETTYGPSDWGHVKCADHETCPGWPDDWESLNPFIPYKETDNHCLDCSNNTRYPCRKHKQSPLNLLRSVTYHKECKDRHLMGFSKGDGCGFGRMNLTIERQSLRAMQPTDCNDEPKIDFSMGFPVPWHLRYTDIKVPSEHMLEGVRYQAEVQLAHIYSSNQTDRLIGKVAVLLEGGNETEDWYDFLDLYIRKWKREEKLVNEACAARQQSRRGLQSSLGQLDYGNETRAYSTNLRGGGFEQSLEVMPRQRQLQVHPRFQNKFKRRFHPYDWLKKVETEYYFRYEGSQGHPPCLEVVHWRVMKNTIKVAPSQIEELEYLIANRQNPKTCAYDTAGRPRDSDPTKVDVNRPTQLTTKLHRLVFCECIDWPSAQPKDHAFCNQTMAERGVLHYKNTTGRWWYNQSLVNWTIVT